MTAYDYISRRTTETELLAGLAEECVNLGSSVFDCDLFYCDYWGYSIHKYDFCSLGEMREQNEV